MTKCHDIFARHFVAGPFDGVKIRVSGIPKRTLVARVVQFVLDRDQWRVNFLSVNDMLGSRRVMVYMCLY
jgi:hypothetical protein